MVEFAILGLEFSGHSWNAQKYRVGPLELWILRINEIDVKPCNWVSINKRMRIGQGEKPLQQLMKESRKSLMDRMR